MRRTPGRWEQMRDRTLADPAIRERYERNLRKFALVREVVEAVEAGRAQAGISKAELARAVGADPSVVRRLRTDEESNPTVKTLLHLCDVLGLRLRVEHAGRSPTSVPQRPRRHTNAHG